MWDTIPHPWRQAFSEGWQAFLKGSVPIGAAITDEKGVLLSKGRNRTMEQTEPNPKIAHAETEALRKLDTTRFSHVHQYILYTCMEPCPMCMGTIVMANIRTVCIAAHDPYCGAAHYCEEDPYIISKSVRITFEGDALEAVQLVLQTYWELKKHYGQMTRVTELFYKSNPFAVAVAKELYAARYLDGCAEKDVPFSKVFNEILRRYSLAK